MQRGATLVGKLRRGPAGVFSFSLVCVASAAQARCLVKRGSLGEGASHVVLQRQLCSCGKFRSCLRTCACVAPCLSLQVPPISDASLAGARANFSMWTTQQPDGVVAWALQVTGALSTHITQCLPCIRSRNSPPPQALSWAVCCGLKQGISCPLPVGLPA